MIAGLLPLRVPAGWSLPGHAPHDSSGGDGGAGSVPRWRVALTRRMKVTGVVTVTKTAIRISCRTGRAPSTVKQIIEPIRPPPVPRVEPRVGEWIRWEVRGVGEGCVSKC